MRALVLYLNELSCACDGLVRDSMARHLNATIAAVNAVATQRNDTIVRMHCRLAELTLGAEHLSLGAVLADTNGRFAQFKRLLDKAPCGPVAPLPREIRYAGQCPIGLTWADLDESFVFSLGHSAPWSGQAIPCERHTMDEAANITVTAVDVCNLATTAHTAHWQQRIDDYGKDAARSSIIYEGRGFFMRMLFPDHIPPHVHIYPRRSDTADRIARVRIDNGDKMDGALSSAMDHEITDFITRNRAALLESWDRVQAGRLPLNMV
jgi:hypothetical protein